MSDHDAWLLDPKAQDAWYALSKCDECGEEILEGETCPDCEEDEEEDDG